MTAPSSAARPGLLPAYRVGRLISPLRATRPHRHAHLIPRRLLAAMWRAAGFYAGVAVGLVIEARRPYGSLWWRAEAVSRWTSPVPPAFR